ncbi:hypothetical protein PCAR4_350193 [Paraburkholderia caribensis]|jgi:hypothetical protein|nr:hypothetical protein PCAR4_350193 [Paraburkholderia caribensis]
MNNIRLALAANNTSTACLSRCSFLLLAALLLSPSESFARFVRRHSTVHISQSGSVREAMDKWLKTRPEILQAVSLVVLKWADDLVIAVQAELEVEGSASDLVRTIDRIENELKSQFPAARWIYFEPELREHGRNPL